MPAQAAPASSAAPRRPQKSREENVNVGSAWFEAAAALALPRCCERCERPGVTTCARWRGPWLRRGGSVPARGVAARRLPTVTCAKRPVFQAQRGVVLTMHGCLLRWPSSRTGAAPMPAPHWIPLPPCAGPVPGSRWPAACAPCRQPETSEAPPVAAACPPALAALAAAWRGRILRGPTTCAMPHQWNGHLVLHAHGGPALGAPRPERRQQTWSAGPSWSRPVMHGRAAPSARAAWKCCGGGHRTPAADLCGPCGAAAPYHPARAVVGCQRGGAGAEMFTSTTQGQRPYDAVLLTSGVLAGARARTTFAPTCAWSTSTSATTTHGPPKCSTRSTSACR